MHVEGSLKTRSMIFATAVRLMRMGPHPYTQALWLSHDPMTSPLHLHTPQPSHGWCPVTSSARATAIPQPAPVTSSDKWSLVTSTRKARDRPRNMQSILDQSMHGHAQWPIRRTCIWPVPSIPSRALLIR